MALGFTSHYANKEHPFGTLTLSAAESETAGSVAYSDNNSHLIGSLFNTASYDSCNFSVSVNVDYSQYANYVAASGSTETAGSVACGDFGTASTVSSFSGVSSCCCVSAATYTC